MKSFIVSCDFRGDDDTASEMGAVLNKYQGIRIKPDTWVISADSTTENCSVNWKIILHMSS